MPTLNPGKSDSIYTGTILTFEPERTLRVAEYLRSDAEVTQAFSLADWRRLDNREVMLLSLNPHSPSIDGAILLERMRGDGGTGTIKMRVIDNVLFEPVVPEELVAILNLAPSISYLHEQQPLIPEIWDQLIARLMEIRPTAVEDITRILKRRITESTVIATSLRDERLQEQTDAIGLITDIGRGDRTEHLKGIDLDRRKEAESALDLFTDITIRHHERDFLDHDRGMFQPLLKSDYRSIEFPGSNGSRIAIHIHDRMPLESVFGTDILIYQERYCSVLMLQYKTMRPTGNGAQCYWADDQLDKQLARMEAIEREIAQDIPSESLSMRQWRLNDGTSYVKFCDQTPLRRNDSRLASGFILSASHLCTFLASDAAKGPHGGRPVSREKCPRYLSNTQFVDLASSGWIGSRGRKSELLHSMWLRVKEHGTPAVLAEIMKG